MKGKVVASFLTCLFLLLSLILVVSADRGMIPVIPDVSVYEPGQKAIIAWNGQEEILILSTDVLSTHNTTTLEILPLPSIPKRIEQASFEAFNAVQELIWHHMPPPFGYGNETDDVKVVFHEKIGMHDITVVEAGNVLEFVGWMDEFLLENGINQEVSLQDFELVVEDYMSRGFQVYVLDLVEVSSDQKSVEPILYEFDTSFLYYPLLITSPLGGEGNVTLFLLTEGLVEDGYYPLAKAHYHYYGLNLSEPIQFRLSNDELSTIDPSIAELFEDKAWMTVLTYEGPLGILTEDIAITEILPIATGDLNVDGKNNILDVGIIAAAWKSKPGDPNWNPIADLNDDKEVNILDVGIITTDWGKTWEYPKSVTGMNDDLELQMTIERTRIDIGDSVNITLTLKNVGNETLMIWFGSGQSFDLYLYYTGVPVAKWSDGMAFILIVVELDLEPGETYTQTLNWNFYRYDWSTGDWYPPQSGNYELVGVCVGHFLGKSPAVVTAKLSIELS